MALGNAYPAVTLDIDGNVVDSTAVVQFTDDQDQPGSGGGGSGAAAQSFVLDTSGLGRSSYAGDIASSGLLAGQFPAAPLPEIVGMTSTVYEGAGYGMKAEGVFPAVLLDWNLDVFVSDALGTNVATFVAGGTFTGTGAPQSETFDGSGGEWTILAGTDLTATGTSLASTAGGAFFIVFSGTVGPD